jgi:ABC-type Na+ efflux pump permease subunit
MKTSTASNLRIVWAISAKDLTDSIKNKHVLAVILPAIVLILIYRFIPMMNSSDELSTLRIFTSGNDITLTSLEENSIYRLVAFDSVEDLQYGLTNEELPEIALVFPEGFDAALVSESEQTIQGYMLDYFSPEEILSTKRAAESELALVLNVPVAIEVETIPLQLESYGITILTSMALTFGIVMVGIVALPHMMLEEKDEKTLDVMLVSPANSTHIVLAKSLTGLFLTLTVFAFSLFFYQQYFVHWWLIILCGVLGAGFAISIGVGLGILVDSRGRHYS